jgi:hypothetical protein
MVLSLYIFREFVELLVKLPAQAAAKLLQFLVCELAAAYAARKKLG